MYKYKYKNNIKKCLTVFVQYQVSSKSYRAQIKQYLSHDCTLWTYLINICPPVQCGIILTGKTCIDHVPRQPWIEFEE